MRIQIEKYSHSFDVKTNYRQIAYLISKFAERFEEWEWRRVKGQRATRVLVKSFVLKNEMGNHFSFHNNVYDDFINYLKNIGIDESLYSVVEKPVHKGKKVTMDIVVSYPPMPEQVPLIKYLVEPGSTKILTLQTGKGKFLRVDEPVLTPTGWRPIGDLKVGDLVVTPSGEVVDVNGVFPQGVKDLYEFTFYDGRKTLAGLEHLWKVYYVNTSPGKRWRIETTEQIIKWMDMPNPRVAIPLIEPFDGFDSGKELPMDPYLLGALLGDGCLTGNGSFTFTKRDETLVKEIATKLSVFGCTLKSYDKNTDRPLNWNIVNSSKDKSGIKKLTNTLDEMGLLGLKSWEKFIPEVYLNASLQVKKELIRGMMDTDGTVGKNTGTLQHCTTSKVMAEQLQYIIRSIGDICKISEKTKYYTHNGEKRKGRLAYQCNIRAKKPSDYFRLDRKKDLTRDNNQYSSDLKLYIKSVKKVEPAEAVCISVNHPDHLYVTRDFIVTHNTFCLLNAMSQLAVRTALIIPAKYVQRWLGDLSGEQKVLGLDEKDIWIVKGSADFARLISAAKNKEVKAKVIVFSSTTFQNYLKAFQEDPVAALKEYGCKPREIMELLDVGLLGRDEAHEMFHFNFMVDLSISVDKTISLSATIDFDNKMMQKMVEIMWPKSMQVNNGVWDKYIRAIGLYWKLDKPKLVKTVLNGTYNHGAFETSIMKNKNLLESYLDMIQDLVESIYARGDDDDKIIIYAYTVKMCTLIADRLDEVYHGTETKVCRYVSEDEYEVLEDGHVLVSTLKSAGTAVDIKGLRFVLMTTAIYSTQSNVQALGRLRKMRHKPTVAPEFYYLICKDIQKHIDYHTKKLEQFNGKVLSHETMQTGLVV